MSTRLKFALDALNIAINDSDSATTDPRTDTEYEHPFGSKGTEPEDVKYGSKCAACESGDCMSSHKVAMPETEASEIDHILRTRGFTTKEPSSGLYERGLARVRLEAAPNGGLRWTYKTVSAKPGADNGTEGNGPEFLAHFLDSVGIKDTFSSMAALNIASVEMHESPQHLPPREDLRRHLDEDEQAEMKADGKVGSLKKISYVAHVPGHKNSQGESAPWVIKQHNTGKILSSHKTREEAKTHLSQMEAHKHMGSKFSSRLLKK
jgi:hypothetical protein